MEKQTEYLDMAYEAWLAADDLRSRRQRFKRYTYGRQWSDMVRHPDGRIMEEGQMMALNGRQPQTNNMIRQLVKCVIGNFRNTLDTQKRDARLSETAGRNSLDELDCRMLEEFLISGCAIQRVVNEHRMGGGGVWIDNVSPEQFFVNRFTDPRGLDIELAGMLHSMSLREVLMRFGRSDAMETRRLSEIFRRQPDNLPPRTADGDTMTSFFEAPGHRCRVIELWTLESRNIIKCHDTERAGYFILPESRCSDLDKLNAARLKDGRPAICTVRRTTMRWHCRFLSADGYLLDEFDSPYSHGRHPFAVKFYPLTDGEVHSFVEDIIDQQRNINRLTTVIDHVLSTSAKGVLLFPMDQKPESLTWEDIGRKWAACDGIIPYQRGYGDGEPKQIISSGEQSGAYHLLSMQMQFLQQISGVSRALQGQTPESYTSAAMYEAQMRHSSTAILDLLDSFNAFRLMRDDLILQSR